MAFTPITTDTDLYQIDLINEIVNGLAERVAICPSGVPSDPAVVGQDCQARLLWYAQQTQIETICVYFYDPTAGAGGYDGQATISPFTLATFRAAAGLHSSGFRRAIAWDPTVDDWTDPNDPMYSHGLIQVGDILGPWIWVDLQAALKVLLWTRLTCTLGAGSAYRGSPGSFAATCADARAGAIADWDYGSWIAWAEPIVYSCDSILVEVEPGTWQGHNMRFTCFPKCTSSKLIIRPQAIDCYERYDVPAGVSDFLDFDGLGVSQGLYHF